MKAGLYKDEDMDTAKSSDSGEYVYWTTDRGRDRLKSGESLVSFSSADLQCAGPELYLPEEYLT